MPIFFRLSLPYPALHLQFLPMNGWIMSWLLLAISTISIFSDVARASASALCPDVDQSLLLLELRRSLVFNSSMSSKLVQWDRSADSWNGVMCEDGLVVGLDLSEDWISGGINDSSSLFRLKSLQSLNLAFNHFDSTPIPSCLANLSLLVHLNLSNAGFGKQIPAELSRLTKLRTLDLSYFYSYDMDSLKLEKHSLRALIGNLGELRELYLDGVDLSVDGSEWCDALSSSVPKLVVLSMSDCSLSGPIDVSLMNLANLSVIQLDYNNLSTIIPTFLANFSSLKTLSLKSCGLQGEFPREVFQIQTLQTLDVLENKFLRVSLANFQENSSLETLVLGNTNISGRLPDSIGNLKKLTTLQLFACRLSGSIPSSIGNLSELTYLDFSDNFLNGSVLDSIGNLEKLTTVLLINCGLSGSIPSSLGNLSNLIFLDLSFNYLTGSIPSFVASRNLTIIMIAGNTLTGQITSVAWENFLNLVDLDLSGNSLEGNIPPSLFALPKLERISLSQNKFSGQLIICPNVSSYRLQELDLGSNQLQGSIPASIFKLQGLQYLDVGSNQLQGSIPASIFKLQGLQHLDVGSNQLQGSIPASIFKLQGLQYLDMGSNQLQGSISTSIFKLQGLQYLSLSFNNFSGSMNIKWLQGFENLTSLDLSYSGLSINAMVSPSAAASSFPDFYVLRLASCQLRMMPRFLANQFQLEQLDLSHNYIQGEIPQWIWTAPHLRYLNLSFNFFEGFGTLPSNLTNVLSVLDLRSNKLRGNMIPLLIGVVYLDFSKNSFHGSILKSLCELAYRETLKVLDFSHNHLNGTIPDCLMMASLKVLNLRNNQLNGDIPRDILTTCDLRTLDVSDNFLQGPIPSSLANCKMLEIVNIAENQIEGTFPCHLMVIPGLRVLVLRSNQLYGEIECPQSYNTWQKLQIIDLSSNYFNGTLPMSLLASWETMKATVDYGDLRCEFTTGGYYQDTVVVTFKNMQYELVRILTVFTSIDISNNRLEGPIPKTLGDLKALYYLNLSHNAISGSIPPVIGNLHQLESLDLSSNYLNGTIPAQLANLDFLSVLNLSDNQLMGRIPENGKFITFSKSSFEGNIGLCGFQLNKSCSITTNGTDEASDDDDNNDSEKKLFYMGIPLGFVVGFWIFCGPLAFIRSWRLAYYRFWDKVLLGHLRP